MAAFVLDASLAVSWCFPGDPCEDTPYSRRVLELMTTHDAVVPDIWAYEIANSIFVSFTKRRRISGALPIREDRQELPYKIGLHQQTRRWNPSPYDAAYLDLAKRLSVPLATRDSDLKTAAEGEGIEVLGR